MKDVKPQLLGVGAGGKPGHAAAPLNLQLALQLLFEAAPTGDAGHAEVEVGARALGECRVEPSEGFAGRSGRGMLGVDDGDARSALGEMVGERCADDPGADDDDVAGAVVIQFRSLYT
jgi:hypothetical protein